MVNIYKNLKDYLIILLIVLSCLFFLSGLFFFSIKIDESKIIKIRYCPSCGIDLTK